MTPLRDTTEIRKTLPQKPEIEVLIPNYKEPILPVNHGGFGWYGLLAYNEQGQVMCHECGRFFEGLSNHLQSHNLSPKSYRCKFGIMNKTKLVSNQTSEKFRKIAEQNHSLKKSPEITQKAVAMMKIGRKTKSHKLPEEFLNKQGTCQAQCIARLIEIAKIEGANVNVYQVEKHHPGFVGLLAARFGSFNKAKQIAQLTINVTEPKYKRRMILEDMITYYRKYNRWPMRRDYESRLMICTKSVLNYKNGGLVALRQEAQKLLVEQDERAKLAEQIPIIASNIEMQFAGTARK